MSVFFTRRGKAPQRVNYVMWLESDGNAFINTGIYPNQNTKVEIVFSSKYGAGSDYSTVFGAQVGWGSNSFSMGSYTVSFGAQYSTALTLNDNEEHTAVLGEGKLQVDGSYIWDVSQAQTFQITCPMYLFGNNENNNVLYRSKAKVFRCQIYNNGILVRDFWPCYDPDGVACLYDKVEKKYYHNAGTGAFRTDESSATTIDVIITGTGDSSRCYATINGTKQYSAGTYEVYAGDTITFGVYGAGKSPGTITIDGTKVLNVTVGSVETYDWTVPSGISTVEIAMAYNGKGSSSITVTTA